VRFRRATILFASMVVLAWTIEMVRPTSAMPNFAQAYGMDCQTCHSVVPMLNAYGRYVQRTGYASLDAKTLERADPIWIGENPTYDSSSPAVTWGNLAIHGAGYIGTDFTFHLHQWVYLGDTPGPTDTLWVTYNNLFHRDGHLFVGKVEAPAPSPFSQFFDLAGFNTPAMVVGEHADPWSSNRWGSKIAYSHGWFTADLGYFGPTGDVTGTGGATDWGPSTEKTFQWHLVDGLGYKPVEFGAYGGVGTFPTSDGMIDRYSGYAGYAQADPTRGFPGALVIYQHGYDNHPGINPADGSTFGPANSKAYTAEVWEPLFKDHVIVSYRRENTDDGLGTVAHFDYINGAWLASRNVSDHNANGLIVNFQASLNEGATPTWQGQVWYVTTIGALKGQ